MAHQYQTYQMDKLNTIARIENTLIFDSHYQLTAKEQKVILLLISKIDPVRQTHLYEQFVSVKELKRVLLENRSGSFAKELNRFRKRLMSKTLTFNTGVKEDKEDLVGEISWFQSIIPMVQDGVKGVEFLFAKKLEPFLIALKEYVKIDYTEVLPLNSGASVRLFQYFKAHRNKMTKHQKRSKLKFELDELKEILGVPGKYVDYRNFRKRVLEVVQQEINEHTSIGAKYTPIKTGYSVTHIGFEVWDKGGKAAKSEKGRGVDQLTFAELKAYNKLVDYGVTEGIALEMVNQIGGSETEGFEDWYIESVIQIFETKAKEQNAGTLVNWFLKKKVFEQGDMFAKIMERLVERKKRLRESDVVAWDNRELAKGMSAGAFREQIQQ